MRKYAIYKTSVGLMALEYADTKEALKYYPYIKKEYLPVIINNTGGFTTFDLERERKEGFLKIIEVEDNKKPLTREDMYPKNSKNFDYGWISPEGDTYNTDYEGHSYSADMICEELWGFSGNGERKLEDKGWAKVTALMDRETLRKVVFVKDCYITKKQADTLFDLGLWKLGSVQFMMQNSIEKW